MCLCVLVSSIMLIMRDGEGKVLTAGNMFYNTLSAQQALRRHRRWSRCRPSTPTLMPPMSLPRYFDDVNIPDVVCGTDLLPLPATNLHFIDMHRRQQEGRSATMSNALRGMYLLTTVLCGMWSRSSFITRYEIQSRRLLVLVIEPIYILCACWIVHEVPIYLK
jgi:hypothetical protein